MVADGGVPSCSKTSVATISVRRNLASPRFIQGEWSVRIMETHTLATPVVTVKAKDMDDKVTTVYGISFDIWPVVISAYSPLSIDVLGIELLLICSIMMIFLLSARQLLKFFLIYVYNIILFDHQDWKLVDFEWRKTYLVIQKMLPFSNNCVKTNFVSIY